MDKRTYTLPPETVAAIDRLAAERFDGNRSAVIRAGVELLDGRASAALDAETWEALQAGARRRLSRVLTEPELQACLTVTNSWWVTGADAAMIDQEIGDSELAEIGTDPAALAAKLAAMPELDRAALTLACRRWWAQAEPRPPLAAILGRQLRGPRSN